MSIRIREAGHILSWEPATLADPSLDQLRVTRISTGQRRNICTRSFITSMFNMNSVSTLNLCFGSGAADNVNIDLTRDASLTAITP